MGAVPRGGRRSLVVGLSCVVHFASVRTGPPGGRSMPADPDVRVKLAVYRHFAETGRRPEPDQVAGRAGLDVASVLAAYRGLRTQRLLLLEADGASIRMAPPFSGVPTQHRVEAGGTTYFANCAWDALGVPAALHRPGRVHSPRGGSGEAVGAR